ncbi:unnamed protein product [Chironomus riparius]|uniref:Odorant receptor n=1 Tax=Chironomus riparius TaxID=315576 RepID=A0A9N9RHU8_9DIPT|nr:unnamed protein product [Chironomus riparius]
MFVGIEMPSGSKYHPRFVAVLAMSICAEIMHINGIYESWPHFKNLCLSLAIYSLIIQQVARLINRNILDDEAKIKNLQMLALNFYKREELDETNIQILKAGIKKTKFILEWYLTFSFIVYHIPIVTSWIISYINDQNIIFGELKLPFTTLNTRFEFIINSLLVFIMSFVVFVLFMLSDMIFIYQTYQLIPMSEIFTRKLQLLGKKIIDQKNLINIRALTVIYYKRKLQKQSVNESLILERNLLEIEDQMYEIIKEHEIYNNYIKKIIDSYQYTAFMALSLNSIALSLSLITIRFVSIPIGCALSVILLFQVLLPCANGHLINKQNDKFLDAVNDFPWYELSVKKRKIFLQFLLLLARLLNRVNLDDEKRISDLKNLVINFYKQEEVNEKILPILKSGVKNTKYVIQLYLALSSIIYHIPIIASWIISYKNGVFEMFAELKLPYITNENLTEFVINSFFVLMTSTAMYLSFMIQDMTFIFHSSQTVSMADVLIYKLQMLGIKLTNSKKTAEKKLLEVSCTSLRNYQITQYIKYNKILENTEDELDQIIKEHEKFNNYLSQMITSYQYTAFMALSFNSVALGLSIISARFVSIPIGCAASLIIVFQVLLPCTNGQLIIRQNEKFLNAVYDFPWYELSVRKRKTFLQFLLICQHTSKLTVPIIGNVDMNLFTNFVNASYSYFMFLIKFVKN